MGFGGDLDLPAALAPVWVVAGVAGGLNRGHLSEPEPVLTLAGQGVHLSVCLEETPVPLDVRNVIILEAVIIIVKVVIIIIHVI